VTSARKTSAGVGRRFSLNRPRWINSSFRRMRARACATIVGAGQGRSARAVGRPTAVCPVRRRGPRLGPNKRDWPEDFAVLIWGQPGRLRADGRCTTRLDRHRVTWSPRLLRKFAFLCPRTKQPRTGSGLAGRAPSLLPLTDVGSDLARILARIPVAVYRPFTCNRLRLKPRHGYHEARGYRFAPKGRPVLWSSDLRGSGTPP
jgi:hypothetical protein